MGFGGVLGDRDESLPLPFIMMNLPSYVYTQNFALVPNDELQSAKNWTVSNKTTQTATIKQLAKEITQNNK